LASIGAAARDPDAVAAPRCCCRARHGCAAAAQRAVGHAGCRAATGAGDESRPTGATSEAGAKGENVETTTQHEIWPKKLVDTGGIWSVWMCFQKVMTIFITWEDEHR